MNFYEMFVQGLKPAIYRNTLDLQFNEKLPFLKENFPYVTGEKIALVEGAETYIFFQNNEQKEKFLKHLDLVEPDSPDFHRLLGSALGYPPRAVEFFVKAKDDEELERRKVGMYYLGIGCSGDAFDLVENCLWLWHTYRIPEQTEIRTGTKLTSVEFGDVEMLEKIRDEYLQLV